MSDCAERKAQARRYEQRNPEDVEGQLAKWKEVLVECPEDREVEERVRALQHRVAEEGAKREVCILFREACEAARRGAKVDVDKLRAVRNRLRELKAQWGPEVLRHYLCDDETRRLLDELNEDPLNEDPKYRVTGADPALNYVEIWYQRLSDHWGKPTTLLTQSEYLEALREADRRLRQGETQAYDAKEETWRPLVEVYQEAVQSYLDALPDQLDRRWGDFERALERDPAKARRILQDMRALVAEEALPKDQREAWQRQYGPQFDEAERRLEVREHSFQTAQAYLKQAREARDVFVRWRLLRQAQERFPHLPGLDLEIQIARARLAAEARRRARKVLDDARRAMLERDFDRAYGQVTGLFERLLEVEEDLPDEIRAGGPLWRELETLKQDILRKMEAWRTTYTFLKAIDQALAQHRLDEATALLKQIPTDFQNAPEVLQRQHQVERLRAAREDEAAFWLAYEGQKWDEARGSVYEILQQDLPDDERAAWEARKLRLLAVAAWQRGQKEEAEGRWEEAQRHYAHALALFEKAQGADTATEMVYAALQEAQKRVAERLERQQRVAALLTEPKPWVEGGLSDLATFRAFLEHWRAVQIQRQALADWPEARRQSLETYVAEWREKARAQLFQWAQEKELFLDEPRWLEDLAHVWEQAYRLDLLSWQEYEQERRAIQRLILERKRKALEADIPRTCPDLLRVLGELERLAASKDERRQWQRKRYEQQRECVLRQLERLLAESATPQEVIQFLGQAFDEFPALRTDEALVRGIVQRIVEYERWDLLYRYAHHEPPWIHSRVWMRLFGLLQAWEAQLRNEEAFPHARQHLEAELEHLSARLGASQDEAVQTLWDAWRKAQLPYLQARLEQARTPRQRLMALLSLTRLYGPNELRWLRKPLRYLQREVNDHFKSKLGALENAMAKGLREADPLVWTQLQHEFQVLEEEWQLIEDLIQEIGQENSRDAKDLAENAEKWESIRRNWSEMQRLIELIQESREAVRAGEWEIARDRLRAAQRVYQTFAPKIQQSDALFEAGKKLHARLEQWQKYMDSLSAALGRWQRALGQEAFEEAAEALGAMEKIREQLREEGWELADKIRAYRYAYLKRRAETLEEHRQALKEIRENLRQWDARLREAREEARRLAQLEEKLQRTNSWHVHINDEKRSLRELREHWERERSRLEHLCNQSPFPVFSRRARERQKAWEAQQQEICKKRAVVDQILAKIDEQYGSFRDCLHELEQKYKQTKRYWEKSIRKRARPNPARGKELQNIIERCREIDPYAQDDLLKQALELSIQLQEQRRR